MLTHFDHVTLAVLDLAAAVRGHETLLGAAPVWRGEHPDLGTSAALFALDNTLIELVGPLADAPEAEALRALLAARGEGLQAIAFGTEDAAACSAGLRAGGLRATAPQRGEAVAADGGKRVYHTVELSARNTRGLQVFAVQRPDRAELLARAAPAADGVSALDHVVIRTASPEAAIALYGVGLGIRLALDRTFGDTRMLFFRVGGVTLEVIHDATLGDSDVFYGLAYRVRDLGAMHARLRDSGVEVSEIRAGNKPGTHVFSVRTGTCNVPTLILHDPARG